MEMIVNLLMLVMVGVTGLVGHGLYVCLKSYKTVLDEQARQFQVYTDAFVVSQGDPKDS